jgi:hypothetical protein
MGVSLAEKWRLKYGALSDLVRGQGRKETLPLPNLQHRKVGPFLASVFRHNMESEFFSSIKHFGLFWGQILMFTFL